MLKQPSTELWRVYRKDCFHFSNFPFLFPALQIYSSVITWVSQRTPTSPVTIFWNAPPRNPNERYVGGKCILHGSSTPQITDSENPIRNLDDQCCFYSFSHAAGFSVSPLTVLSKIRWFHLFSWLQATLWCYKKDPLSHCPITLLGTVRRWTGL